MRKQGLLIVLLVLVCGIVATGLTFVQWHPPWGFALRSFDASADTDAADTPRTGAGEHLGLDGYCPVTLVLEQRWQQGDARWRLQYQGRTYRLAGPRQRELFQQQPERYAPVEAGCDVVLAKDADRRIAGRREHGVCYRDRVYLFSDEKSLQSFWINPERYAVPPIALAGGDQLDPTRTVPAGGAIP